MKDEYGRINVMKRLFGAMSRFRPARVFSINHPPGRQSMLPLRAWTLLGQYTNKAGIRLLNVSCHPYHRLAQQ